MRGASRARHPRVVREPECSSAIEDGYGSGDDGRRPGAALQAELNELISNAFKHGFPNGAGEIRLSLRKAEDGKCNLLVEDNGAGISSEVDVNTSRSLGLRLVRLLTQQIRGSFELVRSSPGTSARLQFAG